MAKAKIYIKSSNGLIPLSGDDLTKEKIIEALGYTPAEVSDSIVEDESGALWIADINGNVIVKIDAEGIHAPALVDENGVDFTLLDESGNIILQVDNEGIKTVEIDLKGKKVGEHIEDADIHITAEEREKWNSVDFENLESENDSLVINDSNGNIIAKIDAGGVHSVDFVAPNGKVNEHIGDGDIHVTAEDKEKWNTAQDSETVTNHINNADIHVTAEDKTAWNNKSDFSGSYNDLTDKPTIPEGFSGDYNDLENKPIEEDETGTLHITDEAGNIICTVDANGINTTNYFKNGTELEIGGGGGVPVITDAEIRVWNLDAGVYIWKPTLTDDIKEGRLYYNGETGTSYATISSSVISTVLIIREFTGCKLFHMYYATTPSLEYGHLMRYGYSTQTSGEYKQYNPHFVKTPVNLSSNYTVGFLNNTASITSLNVTTYLTSGEYTITLSASGTVANGYPYVLSADSRAYIKTYCPHVSPNTTYSTIIKQELTIFGDNRTFERYITGNGTGHQTVSNFTFGEWVEAGTGGSSGESATLWKHSCRIQCINSSTSLPSVYLNFDFYNADSSAYTDVVTALKELAPASGVYGVNGYVVASTTDGSAYYPIFYIQRASGTYTVHYGQGTSKGSTIITATTYTNSITDTVSDAIAEISVSGSGGSVLYRHKFSVTATDTDGNTLRAWGMQYSSTPTELTTIQAVYNEFGSMSFCTNGYRESDYAPVYDCSVSAVTSSVYRLCFGVAGTIISGVNEFTITDTVTEV